jgi:hypothetical protein
MRMLPCACVVDSPYMLQTKPRQQTTFPLRSTRKQSESISLRLLLRETWCVELLFMYLYVRLLILPS